MILPGLVYTGHPLDVAIQGPGFFSVKLPDGQIGYTRDGRLYVDDESNLVVRAGRDYPISPPLRVPPGATNLTIHAKGEMTCIKPGEPSMLHLGQFQLALFENPAGLKPVNEDPVYLPSPSSGDPVIVNPTENGSGKIVQEYLEIPQHQHSVN